MKKFDLKKPILFNGHTARIICTDRKTTGESIVEYRNVGLWNTSTGIEVVFYFDDNGKAPGGLQLTNAVEKTSKFQPVWTGATGSLLNTTRELSEKAGIEASCRGSRFVGTLEKQFEDGEFVTAVFHPYKKED